MVNFNLINILEASVMMAILYLFYMGFLKKETFFNMNRWYLLSSLLLTVTIPFLNFSVHFLNYPETTSSFIHKLSGFKQGYNELNAVIIYAYSGKLTWSIIKDYISLVYLTGILISLGFFVFGLLKIIILIMRSHSKKLGKYKIVETSESIYPFSLFKWIIINPEKYSSDDIEQIIAHEKMHAFQLHSFDLIFIEVLVILFWFNPFIYWYRKSIREIHEYLADRAVVENGYDRIDYQQLLLSQVSGNRLIGLSSRFCYSLSKNRLKMLTMMKSKNISKIKIALAIPLIVIAIFMFANPVEFVKASGNAKEKTQIAQIQDTSASYSQKTIKEEKFEGDVYFNADVMPTFQGTDSDSFRLFIQENLRYPEEAQKNKIEGRVFVQFDIDEEGNLTNAMIVRGVHPSLDKEALRVTNLSPKWQPAMDKGEKVRIRFTFPIVFKMN
ncbi:MAG TPA: hypothetical protein DCG75_14130 [Bacteroidales bacterium]|nr:hypothetical protein [Bacteroidales bacterium]